jgi:hypothetical protein
MSVALPFVSQGHVQVHVPPFGLQVTVEN